MRRLITDIGGATAIEYAIIACLISITALAGYQSLGDGVNALWGEVVTAMEPEQQP